MMAIDRIDKAEMDHLSDWVFREKAASILGIHRTCIDRNAYAGLYPFRVKEGHTLFYRHALKPGTMGNPEIVEKEQPTLNRQEQDLVKTYRQQLEGEFDDVVIQVVYKRGGFWAEAMYCKGGKFVRLPAKFLLKK